MSGKEGNRNRDRNRNRNRSAFKKVNAGGKRSFCFMLELVFLLCLVISVPAQAARYSTTSAIWSNGSGWSASGTSMSATGKPSVTLAKDHYYTANGYSGTCLEGTIACGTAYVEASEAYTVELAIKIDGVWKQFGTRTLDGGSYDYNYFMIYAVNLADGDYPVSVTLFKTSKFTSGAELASAQCTLTVSDSLATKVTFDYNGGSGSTSSTTVICGEVYSSLPKAERAGYTFLGWYTKKSGGTLATEETVVTQTADYTLYAHWQGNSYAVIFNANGGSTTTSSKSVTYGSTYGTLPTPTRTGYRFDGWYTAASGGTAVTSTTTVSTANNHTVYAHWTKLDTQTITGTSSFTKTYKSGGTFQLDAAAIGTLTYKSSDTSVVKVSSSGLVTMKGYGTATITVKAAATGNYASASMKITVKIKPKKMTIIGISSSTSKALTVQWKKDTLATGYQVQISTTKKFTSSKTVSSKTDQNTNTKVTKKKLVSGKKYYVRIRAYKTVNGTTVYGAWSAIKSITVK